jgi:4-amino-4-deoxy-L-arabinose transferase-like glycosyltransferase
MRFFFRSYGLLIVIVALIILRFVILPFSPPGFYVDEAATGAHVVAMLTHSTDAHGVVWPLFSASLGGGYTTPIYLYPLTAWAALFGDGELSLRAFSQFVTIAAVIILGVALRWWVGKKYAAVAVIVGLILPWSWLQGSLAWDPAMVPLFVSLSFLTFSWLIFSDSRKLRIAGYTLLPLSLLALAYVYPPCRVSAPLLFIVAYGFLLWQKRISWRNCLITCIGAAIIAIPLALFMFQPDALERSRQLSVFYQHSIIEGIGQFFINLTLLVNPLFLFVTGDPNIRHSTGVQGMLGVAALFPILALIVFAFLHRHAITKKALFGRKRQLLLLVALVGWLASLVGSALTNESQPHSLRATAAWPFIVILITLGWTVLAQFKRRKALQLALGLAVIGTIAYAADLAVYYPTRAASGFDVSTRDAIYVHQPALNYPDLALQYYRTK